MTMPSAEVLREFLRDNVTMVAPGETLVIRVPDRFTPQHIRELHEWLNGADPDGTPWFPFRTVVVPGCGLGVVRPGELKSALRDLVREEVVAELKRQVRAYTHYSSTEAGRMRSGHAG